MKYLILFIFLTSCFYRPNYNKPVGNNPYRQMESSIILEDPSTMLVVCFSGGGSRAMAMGYHLMEQLSKIKYSEHTTLFDEVDVASGVSGGSFVAAALPIYKYEWDAFGKIVHSDIQGTLIKKLFYPWNWIRMISPYYSRIDMAAEYYDKKIFNKYTFGNIPQHPTVLINATLLSQSTHFVYNKDFFSYLGSDFGAYPIGYAVAASSAFPGGFPAMTLKNYTMHEDLTEDARYRSAKRNRYRDIEKYVYYRLRGFLNSSEWLHNQDGGLAGNTGVKVVLDGWRTNGFINKALNDADDPLKKLIIISVNAGIEKDKIAIEEPPSSFRSILYSTQTAMEILSLERWSELGSLSKDLWKRVLRAKGSIKSLSKLERPYLIEINTRNLNDATSFNSIKTSLHITKRESMIVNDAILELLKNNKEYQRLLKSLL